MKNTGKIILIYIATAVVSALILAAAFWVRSGLIEREKPVAVQTGKKQEQVFFPIANDLEATNQDGAKVKLSDLKGKVWVVGEFFAVCPHCAVRNGQDLRAIIDAFGANPDFHLACISIDPETDDVNRLKEYASALNATTNNWWFLTTGDQAKAHQYMDGTLKFFSVRERTDPADIESNGRFAHDLGLAVVNRNFEVVGKWPLAEAHKQDPELYEKLKQQMFDKIREELAK
jgi:protein SCO1